MFANAFKIAFNFTRPVIVSRASVDGTCSSSLATFVILNRDGWFLTAYHVIDQLARLAKDRAEVTAHLSREASIRESCLPQKEKQKALRDLGKLDRSKTLAYSVWWGADGVVATSVGGVPAVDLGIGKLDGFNPDSVPVYPKLKNPANSFDNGTSLCKLGFPFHSIAPTYDRVANQFQLPPDAIPCPLFPIDGIFTRRIVIATDPPAPYPLTMIETSSPGLRGQSGGPTFDKAGYIWAIQSGTAHLELGFSPPIRDNPNHTEHQFLNVGRGASVETIVPVLREKGIAFDLGD